MKERLPKQVTVTDQIVDISSFSEQWKENVIELAEKISSEYNARDKSRFIVAIGGASGSSKSTTAVVLEHFLNKIRPDLLTLNVGQDGYHYRQDYLQVREMGSATISWEMGSATISWSPHSFQDLFNIILLDRIGNPTITSIGNTLGFGAFQRFLFGIGQGRV